MIEMYERSPRAISWQAVGDLATTCLPSRLSRVRVPAPALLCTLSLCKPATGRLATTRQRLGKQGDDVFMCQKACSDILPRFQATSCLDARDILPTPGRDILPRRSRPPAYTQTRHPAPCPERCPVASRRERSRK